MSRIPVREAFRELQSEGLVRLERDVGARVSPLDPAELREVYLMREGVEPLVVAEATAQWESRDTEKLRRLIEKSEQYATRGDLRSYLRVDRALHMHIYSVSRLPRAIEVIEQLWQTTHRYREVYALLPHSVEMSISEHRLLLEAIARGSASDAADILRVHVRRTRATLIESHSLEDMGGEG